jgi:hypothetical protein
MAIEELRWYASIFLWLFCTGVGIPPCPEEASILYAASLHALYPDLVRWPIAWLMTGLGISCADLVLYGRTPVGHKALRVPLDAARYEC